MPAAHALETQVGFPSLPELVARLRQTQTLFFVSGFCSLLLEVVYVKLLRYWVGNTAYAVAAVLCAYMAGLALGSFVAGKYCLRWRSLLAFYGGMEFFVGAYSASLPGLMGQLKPAYLALTSGVGPDSHLALVSHLTIAVAVLLFPTLLMGATFPVVVRAASQGTNDRVETAEKLYYANLAGAATGTLLSDFLLIRFWGLGNTLALVAVLNALVATWALVLQRRLSMRVEENKHPQDLSPFAGQSNRLISFAAFSGGFLVLSLEIIWTHMVGRFLDSTVYGFAVTLFAVVAGLAAGAAIVSRLFVSQSAIKALSYAFLGAGALVVFLIPLWNYSRFLVEKHPWLCVGMAGVLVGAAIFALNRRVRTLGWYLGATLTLVGAILWRHRLDPEGAQFWIHHGVDLSVSAIFMVGPAVAVGMIFPLVLQWYLKEAPANSRSVAKVYAINTVGCLVGILLVTFVVLPRLGVERSGRAAGLGLLAVGLVLLARRQSGKRWVIVLATVPALVWAFYTPRWNFTQTLYLLDHSGSLLFSAEDLNAGITTVLQDQDERNIYVNDLFNGGTFLEERDQVRAALLPLLSTREFNRVMVIGVGTGQTAGIVGQLPFKTIDIVDFSPKVIEAARNFFTEINFDIFKDPRVRVHIDDGRHYLLTHPEKLSLLTIEVNRLWQAGEGDLYTREFYEICAARLKETGVLQQWVPLFSLSVPETIIILRTVRQVFPYVALYVGGSSGQLVASRSPLEFTYDRLKEMDTNPRLASVLGRIDLQRAANLLGDLVLRPEGLDALLEQAREKRISTDLWPYLEHSNARYHIGKSTSRPLWEFLLKAEEFRQPSIRGANPRAMEEIKLLAIAERQRQFDSLDDH